MSENREYKPGDVVNGHILTDHGQWVPVEPPAGEGKATEPSVGAKVGMGLVLIVVVGWLLVGSVLGLSIEMLAPHSGQAVVLGPIAGIGIGIYLYKRWADSKRMTGVG